MSASFIVHFDYSFAIIITPSSYRRRRWRCRLHPYRRWINIIVKLRCFILFDANTRPLFQRYNVPYASPHTIDSSREMPILPSPMNKTIDIVSVVSVILAFGLGSAQHCKRNGTNRLEQFRVADDAREFDRRISFSLTANIVRV